MHHVFSIAKATLVFYTFIESVLSACYDSTAQRKAITCLTFPKNAALNRNVSATNTCGTPPGEYCIIGPERQCRICNSNSKTNSHPVTNVVDVHNPLSSTWWQSQNWWETNQLGLTKKLKPLQVNVTVSLQKEYLISGGVYAIFQAERPKQMIIERSPDFGKTWKPYQYFATNCLSAFNMQADPPILLVNRFQATCTQKYSGQYPSTGGSVVFDPRERYQVYEYYNDEVRLYLLATDIRIVLIYPGTDGREYLNTQATLNQYYYAMSDLKVDARCNCNGHAEFCDFQQNIEKCECKHYTTGRNCEICLPLHNAKPWRAGNATDANECQECQCYQHATSCIYDHTLGYGICQNCKHNTRGNRCEICAERFYRDFSKPLANINVCKPCNCYKPGIRDDGKCLQVATLTSVLGQCNCKVGVYGRRCDQCVPGRWGFTVPPEGTCFECGCNRYGTLNGNVSCHQYTGQCYCKPNIKGIKCDTCKDGYYSFPTQPGADCRKCDCDPGGAISFCNKLTGRCVCRSGIFGPRCDAPLSGYFFPNFTYIITEPDLMLKFSGKYQWYWLRKDFGTYFSGFSRIYLSSKQSMSLQFQVPVTYNFFFVFRYSLFPPYWYRRISLFGAENIAWSGSSNLSHYLGAGDNADQWQIEIKILNSTGKVQRSFSLSLTQLLVGDGSSFMDTTSFRLHNGHLYTVTFNYSSTSTKYGNPWPLILDSFLLTPDLTYLNYFSGSSSTIQNEIRTCQTLSMSFSTIPSMAKNCRGYTFSVDALIYGGMLKCDCNNIGSINPSVCEAYGGQCQCKLGFGGRTCYHCVPGYFMASNGLCSACGCNEAGSITPVCDQTTAVCRCKKNTQDSKCSQCKPNTFALSSSNPAGCQECFGFGHLKSCRAAVGYTSSRVYTNFTAIQNKVHWSLFTVGNQNITNRLQYTSLGIQYLDQTGESSFFVAPKEFLGNKLFSYGQLLIIQMTLKPQMNQRRLIQWHVRLIGNKQSVLFFLNPLPSSAHMLYTTYLHEDFSENHNTLSTFNMKAILGQLTAFHIFATYYVSPQTVILHYVAMESAMRRSFQSGGSYINYVENATCLFGYEGLSCERCIPGYTRAVPYGGPLINCIPCQCNRRSTTCDRHSGICSNCQPGTQGDHCEKCIPNVLPPLCNQCIPGFWGLSMTSGCKPCNCYLPGTINGNNNICNVKTGQCQCNSSMNVGGRQCNQCKENSYNISLGELQCKECPPCYGLIEKEVLTLQHGLTNLKQDLSKVLSDATFNVPVPLYQRLTTISSFVISLVTKATASINSVTELNKLWLVLGGSIEAFSKSLLTTTSVSYQKATNLTLLTFNDYNQTVSYVYNARALIVNGFILLNVSARNRINQQETALKQLQLLRDEIQRYLQKSKLGATSLNTLANAVKKDIDKSIQLASISYTLSQRYRSDAARLGITLKVMENLIRKTAGTNELLRRYAAEWLKNSTIVFAYANATSLEVKHSSIDYTNVIKAFNGKISNLFTTISLLRNTITQTTLKNNAAAQQISLLKQQNTALSSSIASKRRQVNNLYSRSLSAQTKATSARRVAISIEIEAISILNILVNFTAVSSQAAKDAQRALVKVDFVLKETSATIASAQNIKILLAPVRTSVSSSSLLMKEGNQQVTSESEVVTYLFSQAKLLEYHFNNILTSYKKMNAVQYITSSITPKLQACYNYRTSANKAFSDAVSALTKATDARRSAHTISQAVTHISTIVTTLPVFSGTSLKQIETDLEKVKVNFQNLNVIASIIHLRASVVTQAANIALYKSKIRAFHIKVIQYRQMLGSLMGLTC